MFEDDRAAVMYDLVTDTSVGSVLCSEFLTIDDGRVRSSTLVFDWRRWPEVVDERGRRTAEMRGRRMRGWLRLDRAAVRSDDQLAAWIARAVGVASALPPKN
ncbi:MAG TPA: hypothetical protein VFZ77_22770 [Acidimicrobiales bacterium]